jgi:hypothetical protein
MYIFPLNIYQVHHQKGQEYIGNTRRKNQLRVFLSLKNPDIGGASRMIRKKEKTL